MLVVMPKSLTGRVRVPSSKSISHRAMICAGLANGRSRIHGINMSKDLKVTMNAMAMLGASFRYEDAHDEWLVDGKSCLIDKAVEVDCGESGSTLRFLIPIVTALAAESCFMGEKRLIERPIDEFFPILEACDVQINYEGRLPLRLKGRLKTGRYELSGKVSSQYTSGMLLASPLLEGDMVLQINGEMESKGYVDLTIEVMNAFGVAIEQKDYKCFSINHSEHQGYKPTTFTVEADYSQAAFWIVAGLIGTEVIRVTGLNKESFQGDAVILEIVNQMKGSYEWDEDELLVFPSKTIGQIIDVSQCPDLVPILAVLCACSEGESRIVNGQRLRVKESDRILSTVTELRKLGGAILETEDGMIIAGDPLMAFSETEIDSWDDHRIVMAMAVAASRATGPVIIKGAEAVCKSYPNFFEHYTSLGGAIDGEYLW